MLWAWVRARAEEYLFILLLFIHFLFILFFKAGAYTYNFKNFPPNSRSLLEAATSLQGQPGCHSGAANLQIGRLSMDS